MKLIRFTFVLLLVSSLIVITGCGTKLNKVGGIVMIDGKPLKFGTIQVVPEGHRAAHGKIGPDGRFTLTSMDENDGIVTGSHAVAVMSAEAKGANAQYWHAPKKYADSKTSKLKVEVSGPTNDLKIDLSWEGGQPFLEQLPKE
jgi:hypothetical protein